jgi:hypothetical protein
MRPFALLTVLLIATLIAFAYAEASPFGGETHTRSYGRSACKVGYRYSSFYRKCVRLLPLGAD